jgi:predicted MFS family arabinose efflux permease
VTAAAPGGSPGPHLVRDRLTWAGYLLLGLWAYFLYGFGPTVPLVGDELGVSRALSGLHGTAMAVGAVVAGLAGTAVIARVGRRLVLWGGAAGISAGLLLYAGGHALWLTLAGALVAGTAGSFLVNTVNAVLSDDHGPAAPAALSQANAMASGVGTVAPLVVGAAVAVGLGWRAGLLVLLGLTVAVYLAYRSVPVPEPLPVRHDAHPGGVRRLPGAFWVSWGVLVCVIAIEFCLSLWSGDLLRTRFALPPGFATAAWAAVLAGMTVTRLLGSRWTVRHSVDDLLLRSLGVLLVGFAVFWLAPVAWLAVAGLLVCGLGMGLQYPLTIGRALRASAGRTDLASARASLAAGLAVGLGPFGLGALADSFGVRSAFLLVPLLALAAVLGLVASGRRRTPWGSAHPLR